MRAVAYRRGADGDRNPRRLDGDGGLGMRVQCLEAALFSPVALKREREREWMNE